MFRSLAQFLPDGQHFSLNFFYNFSPQARSAILLDLAHHCEVSTPIRITVINCATVKCRGCDCTLTFHPQDEAKGEMRLIRVLHLLTLQFCLDIFKSMLNSVALLTNWLVRNFKN